MKKISLLIISTLLISIVGCKKDDIPTIVGTWKLTHSEAIAIDNSDHFETTENVKYQYNKDGSGTRVYDDYGTSFDFEWYLSDNLQKLTVVNNGFGFNSKSSDIDIVGDKMILKSQSIYDTTLLLYNTTMELSKIK